MTATRARASIIPGLHDRLARNLSSLEIEHCRAKYLGAVRIGAGLREGENIAGGNPIFDLVCHVTTAHVIEIGRDRGLSFKPARPARRIVTIYHMHSGIVRIEAAKCIGVTALNRALERGYRNGFACRLSFGLGHWVSSPG